MRSLGKWNVEITHYFNGEVSNVTTAKRVIYKKADGSYWMNWDGVQVLVQRFGGVFKYESRVSLTFEQFRKEYALASTSFGVPMPDESVLKENYRTYLYGSKLLLSRCGRLQFYRDDRGLLSWDLTPNFRLFDGE